MFSPIGRNAQRCCETVGLSLSNFHAFNKQLVFQVVYSSLPDWVMPAVTVVLELIQIRWNHKSLQLLSSDELDIIIAFICTGWLSVFVLFTVH